MTIACNEPVRCNVSNLRQSKANHQNKPVCYQKPILEKKNIANLDSAVSSKDVACGNKCGSKWSDEDVLPQDIQVFPLPEYSIEHVLFLTLTS